MLNISYEETPIEESSTFKMKIVEQLLKNILLSSFKENNAVLNNLDVDLSLENPLYVFKEAFRFKREIILHKLRKSFHNFNTNIIKLFI